VPILLTGYLFLGVYYNLSVWYKLTDKTHYGTLITVGGVIITITLNYLLIPTLGYVGSSWVTLICYFYMTIACYLLGQKYYPIPYSVLKSLSYITLTIALIYLVNLMEFSAQWMTTAFHGIVLVFYLAVIYLVERSYFRQPVS
jgi:O-antigen/teichoic acid export membrane protein